MQNVLPGTISSTITFIRTCNFLDDVKAGRKDRKDVTLQLRVYDEGSNRKPSIDH